MNLSNMACRYCDAVYSIKMKGHGRQREPGFIMAIVPAAHRAQGSFWEGKSYVTCPFCAQALAPQWWDREMDVWKSCVNGSGLPTVIESNPTGA